MKRKTVLLLSLTGVLSINAQDVFLTSIAPKEIVSIAPLANPDRGFHLELNYNVSKTVAGDAWNLYGSGGGQMYFAGETIEHYPDGFIPDRQTEYSTADDGLKLTQLYVYLMDFRSDDVISPIGMDNIQMLFDGLRTHGYKAILRFAYGTEIGHGSESAGHKRDIYGAYSATWYPSGDRMLKHAKQLASLVKQNMDVISTIQTGFIGCWGEWTPFTSNANAQAIMQTLLDSIPQDYGIEIRYPDRKSSWKSAFTTADYNRIGFANDYLTAGQSGNCSSDFCPGTTTYTMVSDETFDAYMSGELPHGKEVDAGYGVDYIINPEALLKVLKDNHYTALDVTQSFAKNITHYKTVKIVPSQLDKLGIFYDKNYFRDTTGEIVPRSVYQFVRDHLGYRLNLLPTSTVTAENGNLVYDLKLTNTGFSTVHNPKKVYLVLIDGTNQIAKEIELTGVNPKNWQPFAKGKATQLLTHSIAGTVAAGVPAGTYKVGISITDIQSSIKDNAAYSIKFAIDNQTITHWTDAGNTKAVNIIGELAF